MFGTDRFEKLLEALSKPPLSNWTTRTTTTTYEKPSEDKTDSDSSK